MADHDKEIIQKIKDRSYFDDAYSWYESRYLYPITERSYALLMAAGMVFLLVISINNIRSLLGEDRDIPIIIKTNNAYQYIPVIQSLGEYYDTPQDAVSTYLIKDYVKTREEYLYKEMLRKKDGKLKYNLRKIKSSSSKTVLNEYKGYMSDTNPYSPVVRYKNHTDRTIEFKSFAFSDNTSETGKAYITFEAFVTKKGEKTKSEGMFEVTVHFRLPDIETIAKTGAPLRFLVKYYKAKPLE